MNYVMRPVQARTKDESFLSSFRVGYGDAFTMTLHLLACRVPKEIRVWRNYTIMAAPAYIPAVIEIIKTDVPKSHIVFGEIDGTYYVAAPYNRDRLVTNLIRSAKKFREAQRGVRPIIDESDLLNVPREFPKDRVYKDDE